MKKYLLMFMLVVGTQALAGNGDLIVSGKLGVGTQTPAASLEIAAGVPNLIKINRTTSGNAHVQYTNNLGTMYAGLNPTAGWAIGPNIDLGNKPYLTVVTSTGNVGIGTTSPVSKLDVNGDVVIGTGVNNENHKLILRGPNGNLDASGHQDISYEFNAAGSAKIRAYRGGWWDTYLQFLTNANDTGSDNPQVRMHIDGSGNVGIGTTYPTAKLHVNGSFAATVKNFDIKDPRYGDDRRRLIHASLEGPEVGVYYRGEAKLEKGRTTVTLPPYFEALTSKEGRTVLLTPKFEQEEEVVCNVAASDVKNGQFTIRAFGIPDISECGNKVYWEVKAVRSDIDKLIVEEIREDYPEKEPKKSDKDSGNILSVQ